MNKTLPSLCIIGASLFSTFSHAQVADEINCTNIEISLSEEGLATIKPLDLLDNELDIHDVNNIEFSLAKSEFSCNDLGTNFVRLTAVYENGTTLRCEGRVKVDDIIAPVVLCKDVVIENPATALQITSDMIDDGSFDNCSFDFQVAQTDSQVFGSDTKDTYTLSAKDAKGNTSTCTSVVTLRTVTNSNFTDYNHVLDMIEIVKGSDEDVIETADVDLTKSNSRQASNIDPNTLGVYPNPAVDDITVTSKNSNLAFTAKILESSGELVKSFGTFTAGDKLNVSDIDTGVYLLEISHQNTLVKKIRVFIN